MTRNMVHIPSQACPGWPVTQFRDEFRFLANPFPRPVVFEDIEYPSNEHAFQAAKTWDFGLRRRIAALPDWREAKRTGRGLARRPDWEQAKRAVMLQLTLAKYLQHGDLAAGLTGTGERLLIEGNTWGDDEWGAVQYTGQPHLPVWRIGETNHTWLAGHNWLGWTLMVVRDVLAGTGPVPR